LKKIDIADCPELTREPFQSCGFYLGLDLLATSQKAVQQLFDRTVFFIPRSIKERNQSLVGHSLDLLNSRQSGVTAEIADLLGQPLKRFIARRVVRQDVGRRLNLDGAGLLELAPDGYALSLVGGGQAEKEEKPG
jgi:hypothetical protein